MGKEKVIEVVLQNFSGKADGFFDNTRTAASLVLGTALGSLFSLGSYTKGNNRTSLELALVKVYQLLNWTAFVLSLNTVITCTVVSTTILHGRFDPMAETPYLLLKREFEYEFVAVRWSMLVCLLLFLVMVTLRVLLELSDPARRDTAKFVLCSSTALFSHLLSYINSTLCCWPNLWEMTLHMFRVVVTHTTSELGSLKIISALATVGGVYFGLKTGLTPPPATKDKED